jgi:hypothetical protein
MDFPPEVLDTIVSFSTCAEFGGVYLLLSRFHYSVLCSHGWKVLSEVHMRLFTSKAVGTYKELLEETKLFREPHGGNCIEFINSGEEVAYFKTSIRLDAVTQGVYIQVWVHHHWNSLSISLVDFDGRGSSSLTFSPDEGLVIRERKLLIDSDRVEGQYTECMPAARRFAKNKTGGWIGMYIDRNLGIEFFRQRARRKPETSGLVSDCSWVHGGVVTPCISFSGPGKYEVKAEFMRVSPRPKNWPKLEEQHKIWDWKKTSWDTN